MDEIRELLQRLGQLTDEEIASLRELVKAKFSELDTDDASVDDTAILVELGEITEQIMAEGAARETKAQEAKEQRDAAREKIKAISGDPEEETPEGEDEAAEEETPETETETEETPEETAEETATEESAVAATGAVQTMARAAGKPKPSPEAAPERTTGVLVAAGGYQAGRPVSDWSDLGKLMGEAAWRQISGNVTRTKEIVASAKFDYPEGHVIDTLDATRAAEIIDAICSPGAQAYDRKTGQALGKALVATGGICQPVNVDYSIPTLATAERPIRDGLPSFEATRGGIRYIVPPDIEEWQAATGIWTEATDAEPAGATKPVKVLACGNEEDVYVEAVSTRIGFGNMQARFAPEQVAANTDLAIAGAARVAEENLLNLIEGVCVKKLETAQHLGIGRDLLAAVDYALSAYRNIHRIPRAQAFTAIFPEWVKDLIRTDIAREQAHDNGGSFNVWEITDEQIEAFFSMRHINVIWHLDGQKEPTSKNYKTQYWGTPAEGKKLDELLPNEVLPWYFFPEGAIQFLDAGRLDLGVVRDSTLDATNDYETFVETFEGVANRAFTKGVWQILSSVKATGGSAATITAVAP
jgi:hypothetical protein